MTPCARLVGALVFVLHVPAASAQPLAPLPAAPDAAIEQQLGAYLPANLRLTDSDGRPITLGALLGDRPMLLALGYYRCPQLCGLLMHGLLEGLHDSRLAPDTYRIVRVSLDPEDTPASARTRRDIDLAFARHLGGALPELDLLTGAPPAIAVLAQRVGFHYSPGDGVGDARFAHPAAIVVVTPDGRVSRYLMGVRFEPSTLRGAVLEASHGEIGSWTDRLALLCAHVDPRLGSRSGAVLLGLQLLGVLLVALLALLWWRLASRPRGVQP